MSIKGIKDLIYTKMLSHTLDASNFKWSNKRFNVITLFWNKKTPTIQNPRKPPNLYIHLNFNREGHS